MADVEGAMPLTERLQLRESLRASKDAFITALPKVELHLHIEGIITPALKWKLSQRNGQVLKHPRTGVVFSSLEALEDSHDVMKDRNGERMDNAEETLSFFEAYYGGFEVLKTKRDYYDLAMEYFVRAAEMNVRYCELFFDPQGHTRCGTKWETMMEGFREAQEAAERDLKIKSAWIMCFLRDMSPESAMEHYLAALPYHDMIVGIGLDSNEDQRPPNLFADLFARARADGFRLTCHCDVGATYPVEHVRQVVQDVGGDRIDHGQNVVDSPELMREICERDVGMTICPWSCIRHQPPEEVFRRIRALFDAGIRLAIGSDDPAFMEDTWVEENLMVVRRYCGFGNAEVARLTRDAIEMSWAPAEVKEELLGELRKVIELDEKGGL